VKVKVGPLLAKAGLWLAGKGAEEVLRAIQRKKHRRAPEAGLDDDRDVASPKGDPDAVEKALARADRTQRSWDDS
jgi:predicted DNA repair protein MutK